MTETGRRLGRYRLEERLGQGGMAEVWRAKDERLGRTVAVKVILATHARDGHFRERFHKEAQLVASLDHPNILPVFDYGDEDGVPYIVMPYLDGGTLRDRMVGSPVPFAQAVSWIRQLGDALDAAHAAGILHRDVKPANVLIRRDDRLALADFGIAKMLETSTGLTATGMVVGTPIYMAPEQAQGKPATPASDRYALGVLAFELMSGKPPFEGESALALMHQHVTAPAPLLSTSVHGLPVGLDPIFEKALAKEPERRPPTCRAFADQLLAFVPTGAGLDIERATAPWSPVERTSPTVYEATPKRAAEGSALRGPGLTSQPTISTSPQPSRRTLLAAAGAAAGVVVLGGAWLLVPRPARVAAPAPPAIPSVPTTVPERVASGEGKAVTLPMPTARAGSVESGSGGRPVAPLPAANAAAARETNGPAPGQEKPADAESRPAREGLPAPVPPGAGGPSGSSSTDGLGEEGGVRGAHARLNPLFRAGKRPTRDDFDAALRGARATLATEPGKPGARVVELYALGGLAYLERKDADALRQLLAAETLAGKAGAWDARLLRAGARWAHGGSDAATWELALAFGDARHEAEGLLARDLAKNPNDPRALLGRASLRRMDGRDAEAIVDATAVFESRPSAFLRARAAELIADENAAREKWEEAARWYREAAIPQNAASARAGWEGARILEERLGRADEAGELYAAACRAGNRKACLKSGERAPRRLFPRRRAP